MYAWESAVFRGEVARTVKAEYIKLLSVKKNGETAEQLLVDHFEKRLMLDLQTEGRFWFALALCEWQHGRLTQRAKEKALMMAKYPRTDISPDVVKMLISTLDKPMPTPKKVRPPSHVAHCPWPIGSLLAYRIISSDRPRVTESTYYKKYVLLRIIKIIRTPISRLAPEDGWSERMLVGLYDWVGDSIPDPEIVDNLSFTAVATNKPLLSAAAFQNVSSPLNSDRDRQQMQELINRMASPRIETCCDLSWQCARGIRRNDVFTFLACDPSFEDESLPFFKTAITDYAMSHSIPFDSVLVNRLTQLEQEKQA